MKNGKKLNGVMDDIKNESSSSEAGKSIKRESSDEDMEVKEESSNEEGNEEFTTEQLSFNPFAPFDKVVRIFLSQLPSDARVTIDDFLQFLEQNRSNAFTEQFNLNYAGLEKPEMTSIFVQAMRRMSETTPTSVNYNPFQALNHFVSAFIAQQETNNRPITASEFQRFLRQRSDGTSSQQHLSGLSDSEMSVLFNEAVRQLNASGSNRTYARNTTITNNPFAPFDHIVRTFLNQLPLDAHVTFADFQQFINARDDLNPNFSGLRDSQRSQLFSQAMLRINGGDLDSPSSQWASDIPVPYQNLDEMARLFVPGARRYARKTAGRSDYLMPIFSYKNRQNQTPKTAARKSAPSRTATTSHHQNLNAGMDDITAMRSALRQSENIQQPFDINGGYDEEAAMQNAISNSQHEPVLVSNTTTSTSHLQFMEITNASILEARKYLKIADDQLDQAVQLYFINASENPLLVQTDNEIRKPDVLSVEPHHLVQVADDSYQFVGDLSKRVENWPSDESDEELDPPIARRAPRQRPPPSDDSDDLDVYQVPQTARKQAQPRQTARKVASGGRPRSSQIARKSSGTLEVRRQLATKAADTRAPPIAANKRRQISSTQRITRQTFLSSSSSEQEQEPVSTPTKRKARAPTRRSKIAKTIPEPVGRESSIPADVKPPSLFQGLILTPNSEWKRTPSTKKAPQPLYSSPLKAARRIESEEASFEVQMIPNKTASRITARKTAATGSSIRTAARKSAPLIINETMQVDELALVRNKRQIAQPMEMYNKEIESSSDLESGEEVILSIPEDVYERHRKPSDSPDDSVHD